MEGLVNYGRMIRGAEVAGLVWEQEPREDGTPVTKVSLRSQGDVDVSVIAVALGGGGHRNAAGAQVNASLDETARRIRDEALGLLQA